MGSRGSVDGVGLQVTSSSYAAPIPVQILGRCEVSCSMFGIHVVLVIALILVWGSELVGVKQQVGCRGQSFKGQ